MRWPRRSEVSLILTTPRRRALRRGFSFPHQDFDMSFADTLKQLPKVSHLEAIQLIDAEGAVVATIENKPGQAGSLAVYNHLAQLHGSINIEAAKKGVELYAEHTEDARANPGKHPNIDRLISIAEGKLAALRVKHVFAV
nr:DUF2322 family protein [Niveibacterium sp. COAC-50]